MSVNFIWRLSSLPAAETLSMSFHFFGLKLTTHIKCQNWSRHALLPFPTLSVVSLSMLYATCLVMPSSLQPCGLQPTRLLCPWDCPGKITGMGCHFSLQGIFLIQGSNLGLQHWQADSLPSEPPGGPPGKPIEISLWHLWSVPDFWSFLGKLPLFTSLAYFFFSVPTHTIKFCLKMSLQGSS